MGTAEGLEIASLAKYMSSWHRSESYWPNFDHKVEFYYIQVLVFLLF